MSDTDADTVTFKGQNYGTAWLVVRGSSEAELSKKISEYFGADLDAQSFPELVMKANALWNAIEAAVLTPQTVAPSAAPVDHSAPQKAGPPAPRCQHGPRIRKTGTGKRGQWAGWFCPERNKAIQCDVEWEND